MRWSHPPRSFLPTSNNLLNELALEDWIGR
jgi:hypothetical protein